MDKFAKLISLKEKLDKGEYGTWHVDTEHKGTRDDPIHVPFPIYSETVEELVAAVYEFNDNNPDYDLYNYYEILRKYGIEKMKDVDIDTLDNRCVMALLMSIIRAERFCDGYILEELENGNIQKLLGRLKTISVEQDI